jgi:hypothetical protein
MLSPEKAELVDHLHRHLHARVDGADHRDVADFVEGDIGRRTRCLRAEIEFIALARGHDVVRNGVVIEEGQRLAPLDRDAFGGEGAALLVDDFVRRERSGGEAADDGTDEQAG